MRLAFVIQRYGREVVGGAELHCRWLAERLARTHQVEVFATRAQDYIEWRNTYAGGSEIVNGIRVHRYRTVRQRNIRKFSSLSNIVFYEPHTRDEEEAWIKANGPDSPALVRAVVRAAPRFDLILFYCFRYYHSYFGLPRVRSKAVLVPTAEEDPAVRLSVFAPVFRMPRGIVYLTPEEQALIEDVSGNHAVPSAVIGSGLNMPAANSRLNFAAAKGLTKPFVLYVGRIDKNKGCITMFAYFQKFIEETGRDVDLVVAGNPVIPIPNHPRIRHVGLITDEEKVAALCECQALVMPSPFESLSIIVLEAWKLGAPVLANARCQPLKGQCLRSNGGLFFHGYAEFSEALKLLLDRPDLARALGRQGQQYVEREYTWETIEQRLERLFQQIAADGSPRRS